MYSLPTLKKEIKSFYNKDYLYYFKTYGSVNYATLTSGGMVSYSAPMQQ